MKPAMSTSQTKLILLEGIPGSGKSSAGVFIEGLFRAQGREVTFWREGDFDNPADFEGVACLTSSQYQDFASRHPHLNSWLAEQLTIQDDDYLLWYRRLQTLHAEVIDQALIEELAHYDVYDGLGLEEYGRLALRRWQDFERSAAGSEQTTILECCFLQNPLTVMLARHNVDPQVACQQVIKIAEVIQRLNPQVIYLAPVNARKTLEHVRAERPKGWSEFVTWYLTCQAYGKTHNLTGYEGVIQFYEMRQKLELDMLNDIPLQSVVVKHSGNEWEQCYEQIIKFVSPHLQGRVRESFSGGNKTC